MSSGTAYMDYRNLIQFTPAGKGETVSGKRRKTQPSSDILTGEQAKSFYESVVDSTDIIAAQKGLEREKLNKKVSDQSECINTPENACFNVTRERAATRKHRTVYSVHDQKTALSSERTNHSINSSTHQTSTRSASQIHRQCNDLLKFSQNGELKELKKLLQKCSGVPIDYQDSYGWTPLMCAVVSGHAHITQYLLMLGANKNLQNMKGERAIDLAIKISSGSLINILQETTYSQTYSQKKKRKETSCKFYCEICKFEFTDSTEKAHKSSTVHLFNMNLKPKPDPFMIPESNVGYRLMQKSGWDGEKGLGPKGQGQKYPVKTALKRDRSCLGSDDHKQAKAKITHFKPNDVSAIKSVHKRSERIMSARAVSKRVQRRKEIRDKEWERDLRLEFNME